MSYTSHSYKLRSAGPVPIGGRGTVEADFIVQTFKVEHSEIIIHEATEVLLESNDMAGLGGNHVSANYQRLPLLTAEKKQVFSGSEIKKPTYEEEDEYLP